MRERKHPRLKGYDYSQNGAYFVTVCTKERKNCLSRIRVGPDALIGPSVELMPYGELVNDAILSAVSTYENVNIPCYVIMPNHVHLLVVLGKSGPMGASGPTLGMIVRSIKTKVTRAVGHSVWQTSYYDHVIRDERDFLTRWNYIESNPAKWPEDTYYRGNCSMPNQTKES